MFTTTSTQTTRTLSANSTPTRKGVVRTLLILDAAWREKQSLKKLDEAALRDMGLPGDVARTTGISDIIKRTRQRS